MAYPLLAPTVRRLIPLYIRNGYTPQQARAAIQSRFDLRVPRNTFYAQFREIRNAFNFAPFLARLERTRAVPDRYIVDSAHPLPQRYEFTMKFLGTDPRTGESFVRYATVYDDDKLSPEQAYQKLRREQAAFNAAQDPNSKYFRGQVEEQAPFEGLVFESVKRVNLR